MRPERSTQRTESSRTSRVRAGCLPRGSPPLLSQTPFHTRLNLCECAHGSLVATHPAPRWFDGQRAAESRQGTLTEYFNGLMGLPVKISRCPHLLDFFKVRPDDLKLPTDSQCVATSPGEKGTWGQNAQRVRSPKFRLPHRQGSKPVS